MNLRTGWNKEIWKGACNNMASIRERNGKFNVISIFIVHMENLSPSNLLKSPSFSIKMMEINSK